MTLPHALQYINDFCLCFCNIEAKKNMFHDRYPGNITCMSPLDILNWIRLDWFLSVLCKYVHNCIVDWNICHYNLQWTLELMLIAL